MKVNDIQTSRTPAMRDFAPTGTERNILERLGSLVTLKRYCTETGDTPYAVHNRRRRGQWIDGIHCVLKSRRRLWINVAAANAWLLDGGK